MNVPNEFIEFLKKDVKRLQSDYPHANLSDAFTHWATQLILPELDPDQIFDLVVGISGKNDKGLDLAYRDERNGVHYLFQAKYPNEPTEFGPDPVRELLTAYETFLGNRETIGVERLIAISNELKDSVQRDYEIRFCIVVYGTLNATAKQELENRCARISNASWIVYDLKELYDLHFTTSEIRYEIEDIELTLPLFSGNDKDGGVLYIEALDPYAVVVNVDLLAYARSVAQYIPRIFDANVRHPLKNKVNRKIAQTITDPTERSYFWHYNNGLTILVQDLSIQDNQISVSGASIVNGCQTTDTLSKTIQRLGTDADSIKLPLLIRFIKIAKHDELSTLRVNIARYTNSQAPVVTPDFKSNEDEQDRIAHLFTMLTPPVFYERKRGQWGAMSPSKKRKFSDSVSMVEIAQQWYAFRVSPSLAITSKNELFEDSGFYKEIFTPPRSAAEYYLAHLLFKQFNENLVSKKTEAEGKDDPDSKFIIELSRAKNLVVAHLTRLVGVLICEKYGVINDQVASNVLSLVRDGDVVRSLEPLLMGVLEMYYMSVVGDPDIQGALTKEWRNPNTIEKLRRFLLRQVSMYSQARINVLDFI